MFNLSKIHKKRAKSQKNGRFPPNVRLNGLARFKTGDLATLLVWSLSVFLLLPPATPYWNPASWCTSPDNQAATMWSMSTCLLLLPATPYWHLASWSTSPENQAATMWSLSACLLLLPVNPYWYPVSWPTSWAYLLMLSPHHHYTGHKLGSSPNLQLLWLEE